MARDDWFRKSTWSDSDRGHFFERLNRSRSIEGKAQYLRIQACHLQMTGSKELIPPALELLDLIIRDFPINMELAQTYFQKAECLLALGRDDEAVEWFRKALVQEQDFPNVQTSAPLVFALAVAQKRMRHLYDEALESLRRFRPAFPVQHYESFGAQALIAQDRGNLDEACRYAREAIKAASLQHSGFRNHPNIGLVTDKGSELYARLKALAES